MFGASGSHDKEGRHAHMLKIFKTHLHRNQRTDSHETQFLLHWGPGPIIVCSNDDHGLTLT